MIERRNRVYDKLSHIIGKRLAYKIVVNFL